MDAKKATETKSTTQDQMEKEQHSMRRKIEVLVKLFEREELTKDEIVHFCRARQPEMRYPIKAVSKDLEYFKDNVPFVNVEDDHLRWVAEQCRCWKGTGVYSKLLGWDASNSRLSDIALSVLAELKPGTLLVGKGTTCHAIMKRVFGSGLGVPRICTGNLLVVCEAIRRNAAASIWVPEGAIDVMNAYFLDQSAVKALGDQVVDASLTSFMGVKCTSNEDPVEFYGNQEGEKGDKLMNLAPKKACRHIIIALSWEKIGRGGVLVATDQDLKEERNYFIVTDIPPRDPKDKVLESKWDVLDRLGAMSNVQVRTSVAS